MSYIHFKREERERHKANPLCGVLTNGETVTDGKYMVTCWRCIHLMLGRPIPTEPALPEHKRLKAAKTADRDETQLVGEFLEWLGSEGIRLCRYYKRDNELQEIGDKRKLLAKFFGINEDALEAEKMALLDHQRSINAAVEWAKRDGRAALKEPHG